MTVDVARAHPGGLLPEHDGRTHAFCSPGCRRTFVDGPAAFVSDAEAMAPARSLVAHDDVVIDEGLSRWYERCARCPSEVSPGIKAQLDAERAAARPMPIDDGICEVAGAAPPAG